MPPRNRKDDDGCCGENFLKYLLFIFNFFFYISAIGVLCVAGWTFRYKSSYNGLFLGGPYPYLVYVLLAIAGICFLFGIVGCVGLAKDSRALLLIFTFLLLLVFLVELAVGLASYGYSIKAEEEIKQKLPEIVLKTYPDEGPKSTTLKLLHENFKCCGAFNFLDWQQSRWFTITNSADALANRTDRIELAVPAFCCRSPNITLCAKSDHPSNIYYDGCNRPLIYEVQHHLIIVSAALLGLCVVPVFGMVIACCLWSKLKEEAELSKRTTDDSPYYYD